MLQPSTLADNVFHGDVKTSDIFATMALPIVRSVMEGFNGTKGAIGLLTERRFL